MRVTQTIIQHGNMFEAIDGEEGSSGIVFLLRTTAEYWLNCYQEIRHGQILRGVRGAGNF